MLEADEIATDRVLEAAMMADVTEGQEKLRRDRVPQQHA